MSEVYEPHHEIIAQAADWLALLHGDQVNTADRQAFIAWRNADPRHVLAVARMESLLGSFDELPPVPARKAMDSAFAGEERKPSSRGLQALALLGVLLCSWGGVQQAPLWMADQRTGVGEHREVVLSDGSRVQLNSNSALDVQFDGRQRLIRLRRGEVWVEVAKDPQRPFVVRTAQGTVTALGTRFLVRETADDTTRVSVLESAVAASANNGSATKVAAGQQTTLSDGQVQAPQPIGNADPSAWTRGLLKVDDQPLSEVLQALGSYRHGLLRFDPQALEGMRVSGVFRLDDTDAALATLADNLPIKVEHFTDYLVRVKPAR